MKNLNSILEDIARVLNVSTSKEQAIEKGQNKYLFIEYARHYGGYRVVNIDVQTGGHSGAFGESPCCPRVSLKVMTKYLEGVLFGVEYNSKNN